MSEHMNSRWRVAAVVLLVLAGTAAVADERRDPLRPPSFSREAPQSRFDASAWSLGSTLVSSSRRIANINGQRVRPGDTVGGAEVLAIHNGRVRLDYRGRRFTINRSLPEVRRASGS